MAKASMKHNASIIGIAKVLSKAHFSLENTVATNEILSESTVIVLSN